MLLFDPDTPPSVLDFLTLDYRTRSDIEDLKKEIIGMKVSFFADQYIISINYII